MSELERVAIVHAIDCDMDEDCMCGAQAAVEMPVGMYVMVIPEWAFLAICAAFELEPEEPATLERFGI